MADKTDITAQDALRGAWAALIRGDTDTRDTLCALVERQIGKRDAIPLDEVICLGDQSKGNHS